MPETDALGVPQTSTIVDAGVTVGIENQVVATTDDRRQHAEIGLIAGAEHHAVTATEELGEIAFQCAVTGIAAVGDARAGGAGAERLYRAHRFFDAVRIEGPAEIIVGAAQDDAPTVGDTLRSRFNTNDTHGKWKMRTN